jgi:aspartate aminotransferase-like enzyme
MERPIYFTVGPVEMYEETLAIEAQQTPYERMPEFSAMYLETEALIKKLTFSGYDAKVIMLTASGAGAMEALVMNVLTKEDHVLLINAGTFGRYFDKMLTCHGIPFETIQLEFNEVLTEDLLEAHEGKGYTALLVNIHETSSGQLYDTQMLSDFCKRNNMLFLVDAISSFCADEVNMKKYGMDALLFSSQKALALNPGISVVVLSNSLYESRVKDKIIQSVYFEFNDYIENAKRGQTPFTAAINVIYTMREALGRIDEKGIDNKILETRTIAEGFRRDVLSRGWPISLPAFKMSNALTTLIFENTDVMGLFADLKNKYGLIVSPSAGEIGKRVLKVGHMGNMKKEYYERLLSAFEEIIGK